MATSELREIYRELIVVHEKVKTDLDRHMKTFKRAFKRCRREDEARLTAEFRAILSAFHASAAAAGPIAAEKMRDLDA